MCNDPLIIEFMNKGKEIQVIRKEEGLYEIFSNGKNMHGDCTPEDVMRALGFYFHDDSKPDGE